MGSVVLTPQRVSCADTRRSEARYLQESALIGVDTTCRDPLVATAEDPKTYAPRAEHSQTQPSERVSRRRFLKAALGIGAAATVTGSGYAYASSRLEMTHQVYPLGLSKPVRVVALSDLHLQGRPADHAPLLARIESADPDLIVFVGDTLDRKESHSLIELYAALPTRFEKFACMGNWERSPRVPWSDRTEATFAANDIRVLNNESVPIAGFKLVGLDDAVFSHSDVRVALASASTGPTLTLCHCPVAFDELTALAPAHTAPPAGARHLVLAGHTHGGQIAPLGFAPYTPPGSGDYVSGWYHNEYADMYVSRGVGYSRVNVRMGPRPEAQIFDLI